MKLQQGISKHISRIKLWTGKNRKVALFLYLVGVILVTLLVLTVISRIISPSGKNTDLSGRIIPDANGNLSGTELPSESVPLDTVKAAFAKISGITEYKSEIFDRAEKLGTIIPIYSLYVSGDNYVVDDSSDNTKAAYVDNHFYDHIYNKKQEYFADFLLKNLLNNDFSADGIFKTASPYSGKDTVDNYFANRLFLLKDTLVIARMFNNSDGKYVWVKSTGTDKSCGDITSAESLILQLAEYPYLDCRYQFWLFDSSWNLYKYGIYSKTNFIFAQYFIGNNDFVAKKANANLTPQDFCDGKKTALQVHNISLACPADLIILNERSIFDAIPVTEILKKDDYQGDPYAPFLSSLQIINYPNSISLKLPDFFNDCLEDCHYDTAIPTVDANIKRTITVNGKEFKYTVYHTVESNFSDFCSKKRTDGNCELFDSRYYTIELSENQTIVIKQTTKKTFDRNNKLTQSVGPGSTDLNEFENVIKTIKPF